MRGWGTPSATAKLVLVDDPGETKWNGHGFLHHGCFGSVWMPFGFCGEAVTGCLLWYGVETQKGASFSAL